MAPTSGQTKMNPSRRRLLHTAGALAAVAVVNATANTIHAQDEPPIEPTPEMPIDPASIKTDGELKPLRSPERATRVQGFDALPPAPPLGVIALNRMAFGNRPGDPVNSVDAFNARPGAMPADKLQHYVDEQLNVNDADDGEANGRITPAKYPTLFKSLDQLWQENFKQGEKSIPLRELRIASFIRAIYSKWQLREVLVDFWHNHFNVYAWDYYTASSAWPDYDRAIRANAFGNFRAFLEAIGKHRAMLFYLDQYVSRAPQFNENYARELFELHGMGAENYLGVMDALAVSDYDPNGPNGLPGIALPAPAPPLGYVDADVYAAARAFTGWTFDDDGQSSTGVFQFDPNIHDRGEKRILRGRLIDNSHNSDPGDGLFVYEMIANHPGTAKFIARKLCRRLIADNPPEALVNQVALVFYNNRAAPDQIRQTVRAILLSNEFQTTWAEKVKRPFEAAAGMLRAVMCSPSCDFAPATNKEDFFYRYDAAGQALFARRSPDGYPDVSAAWRSTTSLLMRWKLCNWIIEEGIPLDRPDVRLNLIEQMAGVTRTAQALAKYWCERIFGIAGVDVNTSPYYSTFVEARNFMAQGSSPAILLADKDVAERVPRMVEIILQSPDFQWR